MTGRRGVPTAKKAGRASRSAVRAPEAEPRKAASGAVVVRAARPEDAPRIWELIRGLAVYERMEDRVTGTAGRLGGHLFGAGKIADCLVAEEGGRLAGFAIYYLVYSTFRTAPMMWLEDLFVEPARRGGGVGRALLHATAREAARRGCWRMSWAVLDWNRPAIGFYESLGARRDEGGWYVYQLDEAQLAAIAERPPER